MDLMPSWEKNGLEKGIEKGRQEEKCKTAKKLLKMGLSLSKVVEATELSLKKIEQINRESTV